MKKIWLIISIVCLLGLLTLNFNIHHHNPINRDLSLENIKALQAAAGELYCDQENDVVCTIIHGDAVGKSKGYLVYEQ